MIKYIEKETEFEECIKGDLVLVDFFATWCGPCQLLSPILEEIEKENQQIKILKVDVDKNESLARKHGVMSIPTIEIYNDGKVMDKHVGLLSKQELENLLK